MAVYLKFLGERGDHGQKYGEVRKFTDQRAAELLEAFPDQYEVADAPAEAEKATEPLSTQNKAARVTGKKEQATEQQ